MSHCSKDTTSLEGKPRHTEHHEKSSILSWQSSTCKWLLEYISTTMLGHALPDYVMSSLQKTTLISNFQEFLVSHLAIPSSLQYILPKTSNRNLLMKYVTLISK